VTGRVIRFVATADAASSATRGLESIVLDTAWTPLPGERADVRPLRPLLLDVLRRHDPLADAMRLVDGWAAASDVSSRLEIDGFSMWYRRRLVYWRGLHDRLIWRWVLGLLADEGSIARLELATDIPELGEVAALLATREGWEFSAPPPTPRPVAQARRRLLWPIDPILWRLGLHPAQRDRPSGRASGAELTSRSTAMRERVRALGREGGRLLVLTAPSTHQAIARGGNKRSPEEKEKRIAMATLMRIGWGANDAGFRQLFTSQMMPGATKEQADLFNELQRRTTSPECAVRYFDTVGDFDISDRLSEVRVPTLVLHVRGDLQQPFEAGRQLAAGIPRARFVALQGQNHMLLPGEPAGTRFREELELFLAQ